MTTNDPSTSAFAAELIAGLRATPRVVSPKWFYDHEGSQLFEQICELPEYYPTRTELGLLERHAREMAECIGPDAEIVEFGAGASRKVRFLLDALRTPRRYVPVDISADHLELAAAELRRSYSGLEVCPLGADYTRTLPLPCRAGRRVGFFPGSSIGNFDPVQAAALLAGFAPLLNGGGLLVGVDLVKDPALLHAAYNDSRGVTARFNQNLLARANRDLGADFALDGFWHSAFYQPALQRIEMHLISRRAQTVSLCGERIHFERGDSLHTENSYKYTIAGFQQLVRGAGWHPRAVWQDADELFSLHWLEPA